MIDVLLSRLDKVQPRGGNKWMACCPAHDDKTPSLAIHEDRNGLILLKCFAGCAVLDVLAAVNMTMGDLFPDGGIGEFKSWQRLEDEWKRKQQKKEIAQHEHAYLILEIARNTRKLGKKLSDEDLRLEREAWEVVRHENNNG